MFQRDGKTAYTKNRLKSSSRKESIIIVVHRTKKRGGKQERNLIVNPCNISTSPYTFAPDNYSRNYYPKGYRNTIQNILNSKVFHAKGLFLLDI